MTQRSGKFSARLALAALLATAGIGIVSAGDFKLTGAQEVPPVDTKATGMSSITIAADGTVSGSVSAPGVPGIMAHIHLAARGVNGPVIVPLTKSTNDVWEVPAGAKLTDDQMKAYQAGNLYVNVHTEAHKGGEIRAQLLPQVVQ
ncbi:MAG TPA: CHRD domain-containing protein [Burkholderiaceae bacterium]|jgi:hypothetical protein